MDELLCRCGHEVKRHTSQGCSVFDKTLRACGCLRDQVRAAMPASEPEE